MLAQNAGNFVINGFDSVTQTNILFASCCYILPCTGTVNTF